MTLQFPTMAEQAEAEFRNSTRTISLVNICKRMGAGKQFNYPFTTYTFDDDSSLVVTGRGRAHRMETYLP